MLIAPNFELNAVALELSLHHLGHLHAFAFQLDVSVARDRVIIDREQNITGSQNFRAWPGRNHRLDQHTASVVFQAEKFPLGWVLQFSVSDSKIDIPIVAAIGNVFEKTTNDRRRHHVSNALGDVAAVTLKRDADDFGVLHHRAATIARINLRADLNGKVLINRGVGIKLEIDARNDAGGDRHAFAANWITVGRDRRFELGNTAKLQRQHVLVEIWRIDGDEREIAIVRNKKHFGRIFVWIAIALDREIAAVAHHVRVRHDAIAFDHKTGADAASKHTGIPRRAIIRRHFGGSDAH